MVVFIAIQPSTIHYLFDLFRAITSQNLPDLIVSKLFNPTNISPVLNYMRSFSLALHMSFTKSFTSAGNLCFGFQKKLARDYFLYRSPHHLFLFRFTRTDFNSRVTYRYLIANINNSLSQLLCWLSLKEMTVDLNSQIIEICPTSIHFPHSPSSQEMVTGPWIYAMDLLRSFICGVEQKQFAPNSPNIKNETLNDISRKDRNIYGFRTGKMFSKNG